MAWGTQTNTSSGGNINLGIQAGYSNVSRSGNTVSATLHGRMGMGPNINGSWTWSTNEFGIWLPAGGTKYVAKAAKKQSSANTWYEKTRACSWNVGAADTSLTASVGFGWEDWDASQKVTASVSIPFSVGTCSFNMNILNPDDSEPYQTGEAGTVEESINGGAYNRVHNEAASSYAYGTTITYRNFTPGTGRYLASVSGISPNNTTGPWSMTLTSNASINFHTEWKTYTIIIRRGTGISDITSPAWGWTDNYKKGTATHGDSFTINVSCSTGYHWGSWSGTYNTSTQSYTFTVDRDVDVTANAVANTYTVAYNGNGATGGSTASSSHTYNSAKALTANGFTRTGYTFVGWNTKADGTGTNYSNQQSVTNLTSTNGGTVTLYAKWQINKYTIAYNANGGSSTPASGSYNYNSTQTLASAINKANTDSNVTITITYNANGGSSAPSNSTGTAVNTTPYTFNKWALNSTSGTQYSAGASYTVPAANSTFYALWNTGTTTRKTNPSITITSSVPTKSGYKCIGWSTSSTATTASYKAGTAYTFSANTTLYAVWELAQANLYTKKGGAWVKGPAYVKVDGAWKVAKQVYTKVNGAWVLNK